MYMLIEGKEPSTHEMIQCQIKRALTRHISDDSSSGLWELIGIEEDNKEIRIATFTAENHAYKALRQLFDVVAREDNQWDVVEFKQYLESPKEQPVDMSS